MELNIIHLPRRLDRKDKLLSELRGQEISEVRWWDGIEEGLPLRDIARAHKRIVAWAKKERLPSVLIAEDDLAFTAIGAFRHYLQQIPADYDLYLGAIHSGKIQSDRSVKDFSGTALYMIHARFYDTFLSINENMNIDRALAGKGKFMVCHPLVARQANGFSDNSGRFIDYRPYNRRYRFYGQP